VKIAETCNLEKAILIRQTMTMPISIDQIVEETREMPPETVAELIDRIMIARHGGVDSSIGQSWKKEIDRRIEELESGKVKAVPLEDSLARARKAAGL
jgi:putative addiction module component (TIGR02574 family)